jgi:glycosyltransferase involved in cell wall biosynthesis
LARTRPGRILDPVLQRVGPNAGRISSTGGECRTLRTSERMVDRPWRVLHLLPELAIGGGSTIVLHHLRHADRSRFVVMVGALGGDVSARPRFVECGVEPLEFDLAGEGLGITVARVARAIRRHHVDLVHVHSDTDRKVGELAALVTRTPIVSHLHAEWVHLGPHLPDGAGTLRRVKGHVAGWGRDRLEHVTTAQYVADSAAIIPRFAPFVRHPITPIRQAVPVDDIDAARATGRATELRRELGIAPTAPVLLTVARLVDGKGHEDLVPVLQSVLVRHPDTVLVLVGDGPRRPAIEAAFADAGLARHVRVLGNRADVPALLTMGNVFVFPSRTESFGIAVLEAMAAALPVVAYRLPAFEEFTVAGTTAVLVPIGDVGALGRALDVLLSHPAQAAALGCAGRRVVDERCSGASVARDFEAVYEQVLGHETR